MGNNSVSETIFQKFGRKLYSVTEKCIQKIIRSICSILPLRNNYIVLESEGDFTDNIRVFYEYMLEHEYNKQYKMIWIVHEPRKYISHENVEFVSRYKLFNFKANYYCAVSKYFLFTHPYWFRKVRKEQTVINTTHSVAQLKKPMKQQKDIPFDYLLVCSSYCAEIKKKVLSVEDKMILNIGMPRIDLMYKHIDCVSRLIPDYNGEKIILSMQTFKQSATMNDGKDVDPYALNVVRTDEEIIKLDQFLKNHNYILINKIHHLQNMDYIRDVSLKNIVYLTDHELLNIDCTVNNLLENADILLTDYSSVFYEFLLKNRPIGFLIGDMEDYSRGFIMDDPLNHMPGYKINTYEKLIHFLENYENYEKQYAEERNIVCNKVFSNPDAHNCERLYEWIEKNNQ